MNSLSFLSASMGCQYGGTETYVQTLAKNLHPDIADLRLVTGGSPQHFSEDYTRLLQYGNFEACHFPLIDRSSFPGRLLALSRLGNKICREDLQSLSALLSWRKIRHFTNGTQLLEAHYPLDGMLFPLLSDNIRKILHFHGAWPSPLFKKFSRLILRNTDGCVACSAYAKAELLKIIPIADIEVVYNGVDINKFSPGESSFKPGCPFDVNRLKVGTVARLSFDKGTDLLCRIAKELQGSIELFLAGPADSEFAKELKVLANAPNIHVLGPITHGEIFDFYRFLDCFVLPSQFEAFPLTVLEAMASGCVVMATSVGGIPEIFGPKEDTGFLFAAGDGISLKQHLHNFAADRSRYLHFKEKGRNRVLQNFSLEKTAANMKKYYERIIRDREPRK